MNERGPVGILRLLHDGVDLQSLLQRIWATRRRTALLIGSPAFACLAIGLVSPRWYRSGATFTVDAGPSLSTASASVMGLASQLGLGVPTGSVSPQFYAELLKSRTLHERILSAGLPLGVDGDIRTLDQTWGYNGNSSSLSTHAKALEKLAGHFSVSADPRTGVISFTVEGPSAEVARLMADTAMAALNDMVVSIRRKHATAERGFLEERWRALRDSLTSRENALRTFYERNRQITSPELQFEELRLRREVDRVQTVYTDVGLRLEQARIQEVRGIPAISPIDLPATPVRKSSPRYSVLVLIGAVLGSIVAALLALFELAAPRIDLRR